MRYLLIFVAICSLVSLDTSSVEAQDSRCRPTRQRLMFRLFQRVRQPQPTYYQAAATCPTPSSVVSAQDPGILMLVPSESMQPNATLSASAAPNPSVDSVVAPSEPVPATPLPSDPEPAEAPVATPTEVAIGQSSPSDAVSPDDLKAAPKWRSLFDGKELGEWKKTNFGGEGAIDIKDGQINMDYGQYMTGVTHSGKDLPKNNYEIELEAMRVDGGDFFCGLTFPIDKNHASFVCGGWGGSVVGISSIDDMDASENPTTGYKVFKNKEWYKIRVRVTKDRVQAWINDSNFVDEEVTSDRLSTRIEMDRCHPLGICCFDTQAAVRNIRIREVSEPAEVD